MLYTIHHTIPAAVRRELQELHEDVLPADDVPGFRGHSAAVLRFDAEGPVVSFVTWRTSTRGAWLDRIGVAAEWRKNGFARGMLDLALAEGDGLPWRTYIAAHNIPSQRLFISRGFVPYKFFTQQSTSFIRFQKGLSK
jgi:GNAT superfamily N-acetyltransferase